MLLEQNDLLSRDRTETRSNGLLHSQGSAAARDRMVFSADNRKVEESLSSSIRKVSYKILAIAELPGILVEAKLEIGYARGYPESFPLHGGVGNSESSIHQWVLKLADFVLEPLSFGENPLGTIHVSQLCFSERRSLASHL